MKREIVGSSRTSKETTCLLSTQFLVVSCADIYSSGPNPVLNHFGEELDGVTHFILGTGLLSFHSQVVTNISYIWRVVL